jgi:hypothetical protein
MTIDIDHYQDSGPASAGRGAISTLITNIGWKAAASAESSPYVIDPIVRPTEAVASFTVSVPGVISSCGNNIDDASWVVNQSRLPKFAVSYDYYTFFKLSGTYAKASRVRIAITGDVNGAAPTGYDSATGGLRLYFRLTDTYQTPAAVDDGELRFYAGGGELMFPKISTIGPSTGLDYVQFLATNTTYYTQFLHTRLYVPPGAGYGNAGEVNFQCYVDEYEDTDV